MKLAVVVSGWHFPLHFYQVLKDQKVPAGWSIDFFCVSHRDPKFSAEEKKDIIKNFSNTGREKYDKILYQKLATVEDIERLGWNYKLYPNTIGDWGSSNQWLDDHDYKQYDMFLFSHDDNFILTNTLFEEVLKPSSWLILTNSTGNTQRRLRRLFHLPKPLNIRGSFEFFKKEMMEIMGGHFDLSDTTLTREGEVNSAMKFDEISDWNTTVFPLLKLLKDKHLENKVESMSQFYRMSKYCLEGERGFISKSDPSNTKEEDKGFALVEKIYSKR